MKLHIILLLYFMKVSRACLGGGLGSLGLGGSCGCATCPCPQYQSQPVPYQIPSSYHPPPPQYQQPASYQPAQYQIQNYAQPAISASNDPLSSIFTSYKNAPVPPPPPPAIPLPPVTAPSPTPYAGYIQPAGVAPSVAPYYVAGAGGSATVYPENLFKGYSSSTKSPAVPEIQPATYLPSQPSSGYGSALENYVSAISTESPIDNSFGMKDRYQGEDIKSEASAIEKSIIDSVVNSQTGSEQKVEVPSSQYRVETSEVKFAPAKNKRSFSTYYNQKCHGEVIAVSTGENVFSATKKCAQLGCHAANVRLARRATYDVEFLRNVTSRENHRGTYCLSPNSVPLRARKLRRNFPKREKPLTNEITVLL